tara:strand:- start:71 stop:865 length:795 start_codon:yes stop_codon:yes gene_type:complete
LVLLLAIGNANADQRLHSGDVVLVPLQNSEVNSEFFYNNNQITTVVENNKSYLLFGIPYNSSIGTNSFVFTSQTYKKVVKLNLERKKFDSQNIKINKYKKKSKELLDRIYTERKEIISAKKIKYNHYPDINFMIPVEGIVTGVYGTQRYYNGKKGNYHNGHDIAADTGTLIYSPSSGKVILTGDYYYNGKFVMINHGNSLISIFLHMNDIHVSKGRNVDKGEPIGTVGNTGMSTGPHLHWSVLLNNTYVDPLGLVKNSKVKLDN